MDGKRVTVIGGSGFIGRNVVRELARRGAVVTVGCRDVEGAKFLKTMGTVAQVTPVRVDVTEPVTIQRAVAGADWVINLVGILYESGRNRFEAVQAAAPGLVARFAAEAGATRLIQLPAIGADAGSESVYARSKAAGEAAAREAFPDATVLRPSVVFGPNDSLFNRFAQLALIAPALPLIGGGATRFQPVYVDDVADAVIACLTTPATAGRTYELGGPKIYSFKALMTLMLAEIQRDRLLIPVPYWAASLKAFFLEQLPRPLLTRDQVALLKHDNVVSDGAEGLAQLGITPTALEVVLPTYLDRFRPGGRYNRAKPA